MTLTKRAAPSRVRPFEKVAQKKSPGLATIMGRDPIPTREEYDAWVDALWDGDQPMDELLEWVYEFGPAEARKLFRQALDHGIDSVKDAPQPLKAFFDLVDTDPEWLDRSQFEIAIKAIHRSGLVSAYVLRDFALMGGYLLSGFNQALVMTGALDKGASRRIAETGKWWIDCTEHDALERFGAGFKTTVHVRLVHAMVRKTLPKREEWDMEKFGLPVNQTDMTATYLAFGPVMMGGMRALGVSVTKEESNAVMHLWKYIGWLMGVDEKWLVDDEKEGMVSLFQTYMTQSPADWTSKALGSSLAKEPLDRSFSWSEKYPVLHKLKTQFEYQRHISISSMFLNKSRRKKLGLPENAFPWYPVLTFVPRYTFFRAQRYVPGMADYLEKRGRQDQLSVLASMFGGGKQEVIKHETVQENTAA